MEGIGEESRAEEVIPDRDRDERVTDREAVHLISPESVCISHLPLDRLNSRVSSPSIPMGYPAHPLQNEREARDEYSR